MKSPNPTIAAESRACRVIFSYRAGRCQLTRLNHFAADAADARPRDLLDALGRVPDPRDRRGVRYSVAAVLAVAVCATLAGARSYAAIAEWAADAPANVRAGLGLRRGPGPGHHLAGPDLRRPGRA